MKKNINEIIVNACIESEMKFFVEEGDTHDVSNRWFSYYDVIKMVSDYKFKKGLYSICLGDRGVLIEKENSDLTIEDFSDGTEIYNEDGVRIIIVDEMTYVNIE